MPEPDEGKDKPIMKAGSFSIPHLRGRARVHMALGQWDAALADAEEVVARKTARDASLSLRTDELDESEALRDEILKQTEPKDAIRLRITQPGGAGNSRAPRANRR